MRVPGKAGIKRNETSDWERDVYFEYKAAKVTPFSQQGALDTWQSLSLLAGTSQFPFSMPAWEQQLVGAIKIEVHVLSNPLHT